MTRKLDPKDNPLSLGNLLMAAGQCTQADIDRALAHADELMGEFLVREEVITRDVLEVMLAKQRAASGGNGAILKFAKLAVKRTRRMNESLDDLVVDVK